MKTVFLVLDFLIPLFFFLLGTKSRGKIRRLLVKESLNTFCIALLFAPVGALFFSVAVQGMICAFVLLTQVLPICIQTVTQNN